MANPNYLHYTLLPRRGRNAMCPIPAETGAAFRLELGR